jgi:hypothetical protein
MNTDDDPEKSEPAEAFEENTSSKDVVDIDDMAEPAANLAGVSSNFTIWAGVDNYWALLRGTYSWNPEGTLFRVVTAAYRAGEGSQGGGNGRTEGNVWVSATSAGDTGSEVLDHAIQDGSWHSLTATKTVAGDKDKGRIYFHYTYDRDNTSDKKFENETFVRYAPPTPTIDAIKNVGANTFYLAGTAAANVNGSLYVYQTNGNQVGVAVSVVNGRWSTNVTILPGYFDIEVFALQKVGSGVSDQSLTSKIYLVAITAPAAGSLLMPGVTRFIGRAAPGTRIEVKDNNNTLLAEPVTASPQGEWSALFNGSVTGSLTVKAHFSLSSYPSGVSGPVAYTGVGILAITGPTGDQDTTFNLVGTGKVSGSTVRAYIDLGPNLVGSSSSDGNPWSCSVTVPVGPVSLTATQKIGDYETNRSVPLSFRIRPPKPTDFAASYPSPSIVRFTGRGYYNSNANGHVEIFIHNGSKQVSTDVQSSGNWSVDWEDQPPSRYTMVARQGVPDGSGTGGRIHSVWTEPLTLSVPVPMPTLQVEVSDNRIPAFSGTGNTWASQPKARIEVQGQNASAPAVPSVEVNDGGRWSTAATEAWEPNTYYLQARQLFDGLESDWTAAVPMIIRAPLPTLDVTDNGLTPRFTGICLPRASMKLVIDGDSGSPYDALVTGTTWSFTRAQPFSPGDYSVSATQTINDQTSNPASKAFSVPVLQPIIESPIDEDVDHNPVIQGIAGVPGAVMRVFDELTDQWLGESNVEEDAWSVSLENLEFGSHTVYARQKYGLLESIPSDEVTFNVILFPPTIDHPERNGVMTRSARIDGYARKALKWDTAQVELWFNGELFRTVPARGSDGYWWYDVRWPVGPGVLRARQMFAGEASDFSDQPFTVVPAKPIIESPTLEQHVGPTVTVSGHGFADDWVEVAWSNDPDTLLGTTQVQANGTWSLALQIERLAGRHELLMQQVCEGHASGWSEAHPVWVLATAPTFTAPEAGHWFAGTPRFEGTGGSGQTIELSYWFDTRQLVTQDHPVAGDTWTAVPDGSLAVGPHWVKVRVPGQAGAPGSHWGDSPRFEVAEGEEVPPDLNR